MPDGVYYDGDFSVATQHGDLELERPFAADPQPYLFHARFWQERDAYDPLRVGAERLENGLDGPSTVYYHVGESDFHDLGGGVQEWVRSYAQVPRTRSEYESFIYQYQVQTTNGLITVQPLTVKSRLQFDYFRTDYPEDEIALPKKPQVLSIGGFFTVYLGEWSGMPAADSEILAEDATLKIWKPGIYERTQRFVRQLFTELS